LGEALEEFERVEYRGGAGPQAAELSRMRIAYHAVLEAMGRSQGTSRELIEKRYGPGKPRDPKKANSPHVYLLSNGRLEVHWDEDDKTVDYIYAVHGKELPTARANEPEKLAKEARVLADADRAILLEYLSKTRDSQLKDETKWIRQLLDRSQAHLRWTEGERRLILRANKKGTD
jgi:hypothetical protein